MSLQVKDPKFYMPLKLKDRQNFCRSANATAYPSGPGSVLGQCNYPQSWTIITLQPFDLQRCIVPLWKALLPFLLQNMTAFLGIFFLSNDPYIHKINFEGIYFYSFPIYCDYSFIFRVANNSINENKFYQVSNLTL